MNLQTKFQTINGWTKEKMKAAIRAGNNGTKASKAHFGCLYLTSDGNRCAVGCFIPDGHLGQCMQGDVCDLLAAYPDLEGRMPLTARSLLEMQNIHDCDSGDQDMRDVLCKWIDENVEDATPKTNRTNLNANERK